MFDKTRFDDQAGEARRALKKTFGGDPKDLQAALRRAGRRLPWRARRAGKVLVAAQAQAENPTLHPQLDPKPLDRAHERLMEGIASVDVKGARTRWILGSLASLAFNLLLFFTLLIVGAKMLGKI